MKDWRPTAVDSSNRVFEALRSEKKEWKKVIIFIQMVRQAAKSTLSCAEGILAFFQQNELWNDSILYMLYAARTRVDVERERQWDWVEWNIKKGANISMEKKRKMIEVKKGQNESHWKSWKMRWVGIFQSSEFTSARVTWNSLFILSTSFSKFSKSSVM